MSKLDALDRQILSMISDNARIPFLEVARACHVSGAAIHQRIQKLMQQVVNYGTASALSGRGYTAAGTTGSAEFDENGSSHSWFIGYSNIDDPDIVVSIIVENGGSGSESAVPIAAQIFDTYYFG